MIKTGWKISLRLDGKTSKCPGPFGTWSLSEIEIPDLELNFNTPSHG
jgi:hypothetical protein